MIEAPSSLSTDTLVSIGTAVVVIGAAVKGTMVLTNIRRDLDEIRNGIVWKSDFALWKVRLSRDNPNLKVPHLNHADGDSEA